MAKQETLRLLLDAQVKGQKQLDSLNDSLGDIDKSATQTNRSLSFLALTEAANQLSNFASAAFEFGRIGTEAALLENGFRTLTSTVGQGSAQMLQSLRASARGQVSDLQLISAANRAMLLGVAETSDQMSDLMEVAAVRGQALGLSMSTAFDDIVTGIGRVSPLILDNLGIVLDLTKTYENYAISVGKTVSELTEAEQKIALTSAVISESADLVANTDLDSLVNQYDRVTAATANLQVTTSKLLDTLGSGRVVGNFADQLNNLNDSLTSGGLLTSILTLEEGFSRLSSVLPDIDSGLFSLQVDADTSPVINGIQSIADLISSELVLDLDETVTFDGDQINSVLQDIEQGIQNITGLGLSTVGADIATIFGLEGVQAVGEFNTAVAIAQQELENIDQQRQANLQAQIRASNQEMVAFTEATRAAQAQIQQLQDSTAISIGNAAASISDIVGQEKALTIARQVTDEYNRQLSAVDFINSTAQERAFHESVIRNRALDTFKTIQDQAKVSSQSVKSIGREGNNTFDSLKSKAQNLLSGALNLDVGLDLDSILGREDALNEPARRLADIAVNGFNSPWVDYFKTEFPQLANSLFAEGFDVKEQAARLLRGFEQGLRPELIDKDLAKQRIRAMIVGETNLAQLAQEIATELAQEMNGVSIPQIQSLANKVLGIGGENLQVPQPVNLLGQLIDQDDAETSANALTTGFITALISSNFGVRVAEVVDTQLRDEKSLTLLRASGNNSGAAWGESFLNVVGESVPARLIEILADLVSPVVLSQLNRQDTLTGAQ